MGKTISFRKGDIVRLIHNSKMNAKIGAIAKVIYGRRGRSEYFEIEWIDKHSLSQANGLYFPESFEKVSL